ncbi:MAG: SDR family NAD(P)-dependent oxidoreductase [Calditrichia bacterium]
MGRLDKRNIFITGGSLGIGFSVAKKCAEEGAKVIIAARNLDNLVTAKSRLASISGGHEIRVLDVSSLNDVQIVVNELKEKEYKIDGLVNCAGIYGPIGASHNISPELFIQAININLIGTFLVCHCFVNAFLDKGLKKIVNFSGGGAASPFPNFSAYSASKVAIVRLTENLSIELKEKKININAVAPGFVVTRLHEETLAAGDKAGKDF